VSELALKPGFEDLLGAARAHGVACAVASSSARRLVEATLGRFSLRACFEAVVSGDCVAAPKPAPDIFLEAARRLGAPPSACLVLEDSLSGVKGARAAGMRVIAVPEREPERFTAIADVVVGDLHEARRIVGFAARGE
jgi:HAD superfamily hydrolase (TIGR01509 family)